MNQEDWICDGTTCRHPACTSTPARNGHCAEHLPRAKTLCARCGISYLRLPQYRPGDDYREHLVEVERWETTHQFGKPQ